MPDYVQQFKTEADSVLPSSVTWGTQVGTGFMAILFAVFLIGVVIRKYTSD